MPALITRRRAPIAPLALVLALLAPHVAGAAAHPGRPARPTPLNDTNIAAIVLADDDGEIANGRLALGAAADARVKALARRAVADHSAANQRMNTLAQRLGLHPVHNPTSRGLVRSAEIAHEQLSALRGGAFDRAYLDVEIVRHQEALALFDQKLVPAAREPALAALLARLRPTIASHLAQAQAARARLRG